MDRRVVCVDTAKGSKFEDCRVIERIGYELRDGVYERSPEYVHRRIEDGEGFFIETDDGKRYLEAVEENGDESETNGDDESEDDEDDEDVRKYVRTADEDTPDDPLLQLDPCS